MAPLAAALAAALSMPAAAAVYNVTSTADAGPGTLRQAILDANAACPADSNPTIRFPMAGGPFIITPTSLLPAFACSVAGAPINPTIDGTTIPGYTPNSSATAFNGAPYMNIQGSISTFGCGFPAQLYGGTMTVTGITMTNWLYGGAVCNQGGAGNIVAYGSIFTGNQSGISLTNGTVTAGGSNAQRNVFLSNADAGIRISSGGGSIQNNFIGVNVTGSGTAANGAGIKMLNASSALTISGNFISGNTTHGIDIYYGGTTTISNNKIGLMTDGTTAAPNNGSGVYFDEVTSASVTGNKIANNAASGVSVQNGNGVSISNNSIFGNGAFGIQLGAGGVGNDFQDGDGGPNGQQNHPVISQVILLPGQTDVYYTFNSTPNTSFVLEFYDNDSPGPVGGKTYISPLNVTTDANGDHDGIAHLSGARNNVSVFARHSSNGNTSEFYDAVAAVTSSAIVSSPAALNFGNVPLNTSSATFVAQFQNTGSAPLQIFDVRTGSCYGGSLCYGGDFMCSTSCTSTPYAPGDGCTFSASFAPTSLGPQSTFVCTYSNSNNGYDVVLQLMGNGVVPPVLSLDPSSVDFGNVSVGSTSGRQTLVLRNPGTSPVSFTIGTAAPFQVADTNCVPPLAAGGSCNINATFTPRAAGSFSEALNVSPSSGGAPASSMLNGKGTVGPALVLPAALEFQYVLGAAPTLHDVTVTNSGLAPLTLDSITISGAPFTLVNPCPATLAPGESCVLTVGYSVSSPGQTTGSLTVASNAPGGTRVISLFGTAQTRPVPVIDVSPREMGYGTRALGSTSATQTVTIRNIGGAPATISSVTPSPDFVVVRNSCPTTSTLAPLASCQVDVAMSALSYGQRRGTLTVSSNDEQSPHTVGLLGTSCRTTGYLLGRLSITSGCTP